MWTRERLNLADVKKLEADEAAAKGKKKMKRLHDLPMYLFAYGCGLMASGIQSEQWRNRAFILGLVLTLLPIPASLILATIRSRRIGQGSQP